MTGRNYLLLLHIPRCALKIQRNRDHFEEGPGLPEGAGALF